MHAQQYNSITVIFRVRINYQSTQKVCLNNVKFKIYDELTMMTGLLFVLGDTCKPIGG